MLATTGLDVSNVRYVINPAGPFVDTGILDTDPPLADGVPQLPPEVAHVRSLAADP